MKSTVQISSLRGVPKGRRSNLITPVILRRSRRISQILRFAQNDSILRLLPRPDPHSVGWGGRHRLVRCLAMTFFFAFPNLLFAGSVTGKVTLVEAPPANEQISMAADPVCASLHTEPVHTERVIQNDNGTLRNVFVYVKEGLEGKTFPVPTTPVAFDQKGCQYHPHVFGIQVGQPLEILNSDATLHNVHSLAEKSKQFNLGMPLQGMKLTKKFENPEVMAKFKCDVHPWMNAYAGVLTHPYFSVSGADGTFEIKGVTAGEYTIEAWHEHYGIQTQQVTVGEGTVSADFTFGTA